MMLNIPMKIPLCYILLPLLLLPLSPPLLLFLASWITSKKPLLGVTTLRPGNIAACASTSKLHGMDSTLILYYSCLQYVAIHKLCIIHMFETFLCEFKTKGISFEDVARRTSVSA